ncbi:MAG: antitoxin VapB family protein [Nanoarchaeota archaeon]
MVKSVRLSDNVYNSLKALKGESESFSDVVIRLTAAEKKELKFRVLAAKASKHLKT